MKNDAHRRYNPLTGEWVLVSAHRANRPWQGKVEVHAGGDLPAYDPDCYLCPGNTRVSGIKNAVYAGPYVFDNDHPALTQNKSTVLSDDPLFLSESATGTARVICYSEDHSKTMPEMDLTEIEAVIKTWISEFQSLSQRYNWVQIFENKGEINGCSNPHPHGQIWASDHIPTEIAKEDQFQSEYLYKYSRPLLVDYVERELELQERIVCQNDDWVALVPYWATWPFETLLLPAKPVSDFSSLTGSLISSLATILKSLTVIYDNLFQTSFPYSMGWHCAPNGCEHPEAWQLHAHFYPPLLRSATVKKFMVGYEMLAEAQRDITPEQAADRLRKQSNFHYKQALDD